MGVNSEGPQFVDAIKNAFSGFYAQSGAKITTDAAGWPTSGNAQLNVWDTRVNMPWDGPDPVGIPEDMSGTYALSFTGKAEVAPQFEGMFTLKNLKYDPADNRTTADLIAPRGQYLNVMKFSNLGTGGIRDLRLITPDIRPTPSRCLPPRISTPSSRSWRSAIWVFSI